MPFLRVGLPACFSANLYMYIVLVRYVDPSTSLIVTEPGLCFSIFINRFIFNSYL